VIVDCADKRTEAFYNGRRTNSAALAAIHALDVTKADDPAGAGSGSSS